MELIDSKQLASKVGMSLKWVEKHRHRIAGNIRIGRQWRFRVEDIERRLAVGKDIIEQ